MPILLKCGCGTKLQVRDGLAGKRARCPACGSIVPVPSAISRESPVVEGQNDQCPRAQSSKVDPRTSDLDPRPRVEEDSEGSSLPEDDLRRRRRKRKKRSKSVLFVPLITLFGINLTPLKLFVLGVVFMVAGVFSFLYLNAPEAHAQVVDVYDLDEDLGEFMLGQPQMDVILAFLFHKEIPRPFVLHEHPEGAFLMVKFKISERTLKKLLGQKYENFVMTKKDVVLQGDGDPVHPLFIYEPNVHTTSVTVKTKRILEDDAEKNEDRGKRDEPGPPIEARKKLVAPSENNPWTHEGVLQIDPFGKSTFKGIRGMIVTFDHGPLPSREVKITWNENSKFWYAVKEEEVASEIWLYDWRITCLFPRPASTNGLRLTFLGKPLKMDYP